MLYEVITSLRQERGNRQALPTFTAKLKRLIGPDVERYGIAMLDLSDRDHPVYAEYHGDLV